MANQPTHRVALGFTAPALLWALIISAPFHRHPAASVLILHAFAISIALWFADSIATHALHWMSAHYKIDHATMLAWRRPRRCDFRPHPEELGERHASQSQGPDA